VAQCSCAPQVWKQRLARYPDQKQRRLWLGTKWESRALTAARYGSFLLTCALVHLRR